MYGIDHQPTLTARSGSPIEKIPPTHPCDPWLRIALEYLSTANVQQRSKVVAEPSIGVEARAGASPSWAAEWPA